MPTLHAECSECGKAIYCKAYSHHWKSFTDKPGKKKDHTHYPKRGTIHA